MCIRDSVSNVLLALDDIDFGVEASQEIDILGDAYEYMISPSRTYEIVLHLGIGVCVGKLNGQLGPTAPARTCALSPSPRATPPRPLKRVIFE